MGLLLGDIKEENGQNVAYIWGLSLHVRSDRRADRVEIHPEQLAAGAAEAEQLSAVVGVPTRVVGWYHSHPHITVLPSHVDVRTQGQYQMLDNCFLGVIFSVFNTDSDKTQLMQVTAFQSTCFDEQGNQIDSLPGKDAGMGGNRFYQQKEIPLSVASSEASQIISGIQPLVNLQRILLDEERAAFLSSLHGESDEAGREVHPLQALHSNAVYQKMLCRLMELSTVPVLYALRHRTSANRKRLASLGEEESKLKELLGDTGTD
mmetsp:Transcript_5754/g.12679  ORF Transcript_5754/g.12679 Transcript_5754/m.12679 type:complete len:262 (-) Transcript_5754:55-840(-)